MRTLAVDYGESKLGLAISDELGVIASPLPTTKVKSLANAVNMVHTITQKHGIKRVIIGLPLGMSGEETQQSIQVRYFARSLQDTDGVTVEFWNESFSTQQAENSEFKTAKKKKNLDSEAARIILQEYLDHQVSGYPGRKQQSSPLLNVA